MPGHGWADKKTSILVGRPARTCSDYRHQSRHPPPVVHINPRRLRRTVNHVIRTPTSAFPRSLFYDSNQDHVSEHSALQYLDPEMEADGFSYITLADFSIYRSALSVHHANELVSLDKLHLHGSNDLRFDGILTVGSRQQHVKDVAFRIHTVEGYGNLEAVDLASQMCIQSAHARARNVWYRLGSPSREYRRFYEPFLWFARLTKHIIDYLLYSDSGVTLQDFRVRFYEWLRDHYALASSFRAWLKVSGRTDFRSAVAVTADYLWRECYNIDDSEKLCDHPFWNEILPDQLTAIPMQPNRVHKTIVTPYAFQAFSWLYFGDQLEEQVANLAVAQQLQKSKLRLGLTPYQVQSVQRSAPVTHGAVEIGDVILVRPDLKTAWKTVSSTWYAYVQAISNDEGTTLLSVLWLYEPRDTTIGEAYYPFENELFFSDNCSCGHPLGLADVIGKTKVSWYRDFNAGLFVRQKFRTVHEHDTNDFVALKVSDFECSCNKHKSIFEETMAKFSVGDTVLVRGYQKQLQPAQIIAFDPDSQRVQLRRFERNSKICRPNELLTTLEVYSVSCDAVIRKCHIRYFDQTVVTPYDRDGAGDYFFIAAKQDSAPTMYQGWDPRAENKRMTGLGLFCGGGNLDRGLEEGGAVRFKYAVDWDVHALHSYRANTDGPVQFFLGSVNDYLARALAGDYEDCIAKPDEIQFISAGSPCPAFSALQKFKMSDDSRRNASMIASVVSFVDLYNPECFILENVVTMIAAKHVFSQIIAALVGLGYQVQQFLLDAWNHGSPQRRSRVFIVATAPHKEPLVAPSHSHDHSESTLSRALGRVGSNGMPFGIRRDEFTAFRHVSASQSCADLPDVSDGQVHLCPEFPDHRTPNEETARSRHRMMAVPTWPPGRSLMQTYQSGRLHSEVARFCDQVTGIRKGHGSQMYARVYANGLFPTMVTRMTVGDGINGRIMHWDQPRILTVMEARRAQGYLDHEVLVGTPAQKMRIVGNSVDRKVALVLGLAVRDSYLASCEHAVESVKIEEGPKAQVSCT